MVFGIIIILFVGGTWFSRPEQLKKAFRNPSSLIGLNVTATLAWASYLSAVELIEPAVVYTISAGVMPITAYIARQFSGETQNANGSIYEKLSLLLLLLGIVYLSYITISGQSGFVKSNTNSALLGVVLAVADGVFFTWMLIYCKKMDIAGIGPSVVFGLRFVLYVFIAGGISFVGVVEKAPLPTNELIIIIILGLILTVPHLFALQKAVTKLSTLQISVLTTLGPFVIFVLQIFEGRVAYSNATLMGLFIYFTGSVLSLAGIFNKKQN